MTYHAEETKDKPTSMSAKLARIGVILAVMAAAVAAFAYRDALWSRFSQAFVLGLLLWTRT